MRVSCHFYYWVPKIRVYPWATQPKPKIWVWVGYGLEKMGNFGLGTKESKVLGSISQDLWEKISTNN